MEADRRISPRVIGIGNAWRGDDAAGLWVARRLRARLPSSVRVEELGGETPELLEAWKDGDLVVLVDAVSTGAEAGTVHRFDVTEAPLPAAFAAASTHGFGLAEAVELGRALRRLPRRLVLYGIEGRDFEIGKELTPEVTQGIEEAEERVLDELGPTASDSP